MVSVSCNYFTRNLIATASIDGGLRLYHLLHSRVLIIKEPERSLNTVEFSPHRPLVVAAGGSSGNVYIVDFAD